MHKGSAQVSRVNANSHRRKVGTGPNKSDAGQPAPISWPSSFGSFDSTHSLESVFMWLKGWCLIRAIRLQSSPPAKMTKLRNTITCPAISLQHSMKSRCSHAVRIHVPIGESRMAAGTMTNHAHHGTEDEQLDGEERLIGRLSCLRSLVFAVPHPCRSP